MTTTQKQQNHTVDSEWQKEYANMIVTPAKAVSRIAPGQRVFIGTGCATPQTLVKALVDRASQLADIEIVHLLTFGEAPYAENHLLKISASTASSSLRTYEILSRKASVITPPSSSQTFQGCSARANCHWTLSYCRLRHRMSVGCAAWESRLTLSRVPRKTRRWSSGKSIATCLERSATAFCRFRI